MSMQALRQALRLRRHAMALARTEIVTALEAERVARAAFAEAGAAIRREIDAASALDVGDVGVDALGRWLKGARVVQARAQKALDEAEAATARARAGLAAARSAEASVAALIEAREREATEREERKAQAILDQVAERFGAPPPGEAQAGTADEA